MAISSPFPAASSSPIAARFAAVQADIAAACRAAGREPGSVALTAVTKTQPSEAIDAALATGQRVFGENRVQEAMGRWTDRRPLHADLELRLIGPLQTNKVREALALFDVIETLDREKLAQALATAGQARGVAPRVLIQVNTGAEPQKAGVSIAEAPALITRARVLELSVEGVMCIPPADEDPAPHFGLLARMAAEHGLEVLSMGMSGDYPAAIAAGATHVRVGSALFGPRDA
ncbi:MAG: YggS family pyridoxal phosphate-dependent enzyme [Alphaproteobacteria bacterium]|nr:MAG: YggS family pyridoxal phosphate-dependent enzyme [Alphaproteobacteria bacterium]